MSKGEIMNRVSGHDVKPIWCSIFKSNQVTKALGFCVSAKDYENTKQKWLSTEVAEEPLPHKLFVFTILIK